MKNRTFTTVLLAALTLTFTAANAQQPDANNISVQGTEVTLTDADKVAVAFQLHVGGSVADKKRSMVIRPVLQRGDSRSDLPVVIVRGARVKGIDENRAMSAAGINSEGHYVTSNGTVLDYRAEIPWQEWMSGSQLVFEGINAGKGKVTEVNIGVVASDLLAAVAPTPAPAPAAVAAQTAAASTNRPGTREIVSSPGALTVGDELAARFAFVEPVERYNEARVASSLDAVFDYNMPLIFGSATTKQDDEVSRFVEMTRLGALYVRFDTGSNMVGRDVGQNNEMLVDLISTIRVLNAAPNVRIAQVVVVGFSAPEGSEGSVDEKQTLAAERAAVVRDFITANSTIDPGVISTYNGSMDWVTLRALVAESSMRDKYKVLDVIDNIPAWGSTKTQGRMAHLMELGGGTAFRYISENFFPKLRQTGAYVKVYYEVVK
jgi:hypothetical protein